MGLPKGYKKSVEHKAKARLTLQKYFFKKGPDDRRFGIGEKHSEETRKKMRVKKKAGISRKGIKTKGWGENGEYLTNKNQRIRESTEYKDWRKSVFIRDNYTCVWCGEKGNGKNLNADHIKPFAFFPDLRFTLENGRTLCVPCHRKTPTWGSRIWKSRALSAVPCES